MLYAKSASKGQGSCLFGFVFLRLSIYSLCPAVIAHACTCICNFVFCFQVTVYLLSVARMGHSVCTCVSYFDGSALYILF